MATLIRPEDLEHVVRKIFKKEYPELKMRRFIAPAEEQPALGMQSYTFKTYDSAGHAKIITSYGGDLPSVDISAIEDTSKIVDIGNQWQWTMQEVESCQLLGIDLPHERGIAAREIMERTIDRMLAFGDSASNVPGFLNAANVTTASVATVGGDTTWADKALSDPEAIVDDINNAIADQIDLTKEVERPNRVLMPTAQFQLIDRLRLPDQNLTILEYLRRVNAGVTFDSLPYLKDAGAGGTDRIVIYNDSPSKVGYIVPREFTPSEPQKFNFAWKVPCIATCGGVVFFKPLSATYLDGSG